MKTLQDRMDAARADNKAISTYSPPPPFPSSRFRLELSSLCNLKCAFCPRQHKMREKRFMDEALCERLLNEAYELGAREIGFFLFDEPFMSKNLSKAILLAKQVGFPYTYINTNGVLATPKRLEEVIDSGLDSIKFSINAGSRETYERIHGVDAFNIVCSNLKYCWDYRKKRSYRIYVSYIITKDTYLEAKQFKDMYSKYADEILFYAPKNIGGYMSNLSELKVDESTIAAKYISSAHCISPFNSVTVTCEGYLIACCSDAGHGLVLADLNTSSLIDAWQSEKATALRKAIIENKLDGLVCKACTEANATVVMTYDI